MNEKVISRVAKVVVALIGRDGEKVTRDYLIPDGDLTKLNGLKEAGVETVLITGGTITETVVRVDMSKVEAVPGLIQTFEETESTRVISIPPGPVPSAPPKKV